MPRREKRGKWLVILLFLVGLNTMGIEASEGGLELDWPIPTTSKSTSNCEFLGVQCVRSAFEGSIVDYTEKDNYKDEKLVYRWSMQDSDFLEYMAKCGPVPLQMCSCVIIEAFQCTME